MTPKNEPWAQTGPGPWVQTNPGPNGRWAQWALGPNGPWAQTGPEPKRALGPNGPNGPKWAGLGRDFITKGDLLPKSVVTSGAFSYLLEASVTVQRSPCWAKTGWTSMELSNHQYYHAF